jgi:hypothetical protein
MYWIASSAIAVVKFQSGFLDARSVPANPTSLSLVRKYPHFDRSCAGGAVVVLIYISTTTTKHWCGTPHFISALRLQTGS